VASPAAASEASSFDEPWKPKDLRKTWCATYYDEHVPESSVGKSRKIKGDADLFLIPLPLAWPSWGGPLVATCTPTRADLPPAFCHSSLPNGQTTDHRMSNRLKFRLGLRPVYIVPPFIRQTRPDRDARAAPRSPVRRSRIPRLDQRHCSALRTKPARRGAFHVALDRQQMRVFLNRKGL